MPADYYDVLGIKKGATKAEIKQAFRAQAKKHHPDKGGDEKTFKKINEAYETLSDDQKKAQYDQFGSSGPQFQGSSSGGFSGSANFGGFEDIFSNFFGSQTNNYSRSRSHRGSDLEVDIEITFAESMHGVKKTISAKHYINCEKCQSKGGHGLTKCSGCQGTGSQQQRFSTPLGTIQQQVTCPQCQGRGQSMENKCKNCDGQGRYEKKHTIDINIPAGIDNQTTMKLSQQGDAGQLGAPAGDLYVHVHVATDKNWRRQGLNIITELSIPMPDAILGCQQTLETFWGEVNLHIPPHTSDQQILKITGKGVRSDGRQGDHLVVIRHQLPGKITNKLREALEEAKKHW